MLFKLLVFVLLLVLIARAAMNLWRAMQLDDPVRRRPVSAPPREARGHGASNKTAAGSRPAPQDIVEDARWVDL